MAIPIGFNPITPPIPSGAAPAPQVARGAESDSDSFNNVINGLLKKANQPHVEADAAVSNLVSGATDNIHDVVLSAVKADMSFRLVLELRNRLTDAYQEIMRMQV